MQEIIHPSKEQAAKIRAALPMHPALSGHKEGLRVAVVILTPEAGDFAWAGKLMHDFEGALRGFRYLAEKAKAEIDPSDARGQMVLGSIARHMATLDAVKGGLVEPLLGPLVDESESTSP